MTFVVNYYHDTELALRLAQGLRYFYPETPILFIGDGVPSDPKLDKYVLTYEGVRLKHIPCGAWTERYLMAALAFSKSEYIIKLDPDTCIWRPFVVPKADWFGTVSNDRQFIRGGACGFSRRAAEWLVRSGLLHRPSEHVYDRYGRFRWPHEEPSNELLSCQDRIVGDAMRQLGIPPFAWSEVNILGNDMQVPEPDSFALTHPHPCAMVAPLPCV